MRDSTSSGGWIVAYRQRRAGGVPGRRHDLHDPGQHRRRPRRWHHLAVTVSSGVTGFYLDGVAGSQRAGRRPAAAHDAVARDAQRHGGASTRAGARTRSRSTTGAVCGDDPLALRGGARRRPTRGAGRARGAAGDGAAGTRRARLERRDRRGCRRLRRLPRHERRGPFTRINPSRLSGSAYTDTSVTAAPPTSTPSRRATSPTTAAATRRRRRRPHPRPSPVARLLAAAALREPGDLLRRLGRGDDRQPRRRVAAELLVNSSGARLAAANPADPVANLSLAFLGDPRMPTAARPRPRITSTPRTPTTSRMPNGCAPPATATGSTGAGRDGAGKTWLQYWLFSYYNPQNVLGFGVHEGDWESVQVGLDADGVPDVATYAQHSGGERCAWSPSRTRRRAGRVRRARVTRLLLRLRHQPARVLSRRLSPRHRLPGAAGARDRQPDHAVHGLAGQVGRLVVEPDRAAAPEQVGRAQLLQRRGGACTVGAAQARPRRARCGRAPRSTSRRST